MTETAVLGFPLTARNASMCAMMTATIGQLCPVPPEPLLSQAETQQLHTRTPRNTVNDVGPH